MGNYPSARQTAIPANKERVLVLGASSGIGSKIALSYAARGARTLVVGRREAELETVRVECVKLSSKLEKALKYVGDFTSPADLVAIREMIAKGLSASLLTVS